MLLAAGDKDHRTPTYESEREKDCCSPRRCLRNHLASFLSNVAAKKNSRSLIDIECFLPICQISKQSAKLVRFCRSAWRAFLTMMWWGSMCLSDWFLACHKPSPSSRPTNLVIDKNAILANWTHERPVVKEPISLFLLDDIDSPDTVWYPGSLTARTILLPNSTQYWTF